MIRSRRIQVLILTLSLLGGGNVHAAKVTPVADVTVLGGQYFLEGNSAAFDGNVDAMVVPVVNFTPKTALLPIYQGSFRGTKDVEDLVGGGTLVQTRMDHSLTLKLVHQFTPNFSLKGKVGYKKEWLKETVDETFSNGLFNYDRLVTGVEMERDKPETKIRVGYDFYTMRYPNYRSLGSDSRFTDVGLTATAGTDILDYNTHELFFEKRNKIGEKSSWVWGYDVAYKGFQDQKVVTASGGYSASNRFDMSHQLSSGVELQKDNVTFGLDGVFQFYHSNQNSFDASRAFFNKRYYNFGEVHLTPSVSLNIGKGSSGPLRTTFFWDFGFRRYTDRIAQDPDGEPTGAKLHQAFHALGFRVKYPLPHGLSLRTQANYKVYSSNMNYEKNYRYNYDAVTYFAGLGWEY